MAFEYYDDAWQRFCNGASVGPDHQARSRVLSTYITELAVGITNKALRYGGVCALFQPSILELLLRDMSAAAQHIMASDAVYEDYGRSILGLTDQ